MTERSEDMRNFWKSLISVPNIVALAFFLIGVGGWWQDQKAFRDHMDARVARVEARLDQKDSKEIVGEVRAAEVTLNLAQIKQELSALRDEVKDVKTEVRKIR